MKLEKLEGSENYCCSVVELPKLRDVPGLDNLKRVTIFGNDCLVGKESVEGELHLFFPAECKINSEFLSKGNLFRESSLNTNQAQTGFFEPSGRVKALKFKGVISTGFVVPLVSLDGVLNDWRYLKEGSEFNVCDGVEVCSKYKPVRQQATAGKESRFNKRLRRFDRLLPNQFRFHESTSHLAKNLHLFHPEDIVVITDKWHGTSAVFSVVLVKPKFNWWKRIRIAIGGFIAGFQGYRHTEYDNIYSSRSVVKNQYINKDVTPGYYNEDIWAIVNKELDGKIETGISLYGEIVGYLPSGKEIQKGYDYGCNPGLMSGLPSATDKPEHKFLVYKITYTKPDGNVITFSWQQIKDYCKKYSIEHVKELYFGRYSILKYTATVGRMDSDQAGDQMLSYLEAIYLREDCTHCKNKVPAEGICVRIDGRESYMTYKLKSKRFLERETKELDAGTVDMEEEENVTADNL